MDTKLKVDKDYRVTLPSQIFRNFKPDEFVKVTISKDSKIAHYYLRVPKMPPSRKYLQVRRRLPDNLIQELDLKQTDFVEFVKVERLENRKTELIKDGCIDLLALELPGIMIDKIAKDNEEWVRFWQSNKVGGITNQIELKRFISIDRKLGEFFGLMQAESGKRGEKLDFTNTFVSEHKIFVDVADKYFGIPKNSWSFGLICNPELSIDERDKIAKDFSKELDICCNYYHTNSKTILKVAYSVYIPRKLLGVLMNKLLIMLRKEATKEMNKNKNLEEFSKGFVIKCLLGDGHISLHKNLTNADIVLSEPDVDTQNDFMRILKNFGIHANVAGIKVDISTDFDSMLWFLENDLFLGHNENRERFLNILEAIST